MKKAYIILDFMRIGEQALENLGANVANCMRGNKHFPNPNPTLKELDAANLLFSNSILAAQSGDRVKQSAKKDAKLNLREVLSSLAYYVEAVAKGDRTILLSSGFTISVESKQSSELEEVTNFSVEHGKNSGEMILKAKRVKGVVSYTFFYAVVEGDTIVWKHVTDTRVKATIENLQPGKTHMFYIRANGPKKQFVDSITITKVVS